MKRLIMSLLLITLFSTACGGGDDAASVTSASTDDAASSSAGDSTDGSLVGDVAEAADLALSTTPISYQAAFIEPWSGGSAGQADECPLLDGSTIAAAMSHPDDVTLSTATATDCGWSVFPGGFSVRVEPAGDVEVDDHSGRAYNIDVEPVVQPQDGPGEKAVLLVDTAFADLTESEGFAYAYFFVLDGLAVTLRSTAVYIDGVDGWRSMADAVAANLEGGVEEPVAPSAPATDGADPCGFFTDADAAALMGATVAEVTLSVEAGRRNCEWEAGEYGSVNVGFYSPDDIAEYLGTFDEKVAAGATDASAALGMPVALDGRAYYIYPEGFDGAMYLRLEPTESSLLAVISSYEAAAAQNLVSRLS